MFITIYIKNDVTLQLPIEMKTSIGPNQSTLWEILVGGPFPLSITGNNLMEMFVDIKYHYNKEIFKNS